MKNGLLLLLICSTAGAQHPAESFVFNISSQLVRANRVAIGGDNQLSDSMARVILARSSNDRVAVKWPGTVQVGIASGDAVALSGSENVDLSHYIAPSVNATAAVGKVTYNWNTNPAWPNTVQSGPVTGYALALAGTENVGTAIHLQDGQNTSIPAALYFNKTSGNWPAGAATGNLVQYLAGNSGDIPELLKTFASNSGDWSKTTNFIAENATVPMLQYLSYSLPATAKSPYFEIHQQELIAGSNVVQLNTTYFNARYTNALPVSAGNGAVTIQRALYQEQKIGSGDVPWRTDNAPGPGSAASITLNPSANYSAGNNLGSYNIVQSDNGYFTVSTYALGKAVMGFQPDKANTSLLLSAANVVTSGDLSVTGLINSKYGLSIVGTGSAGDYLRMSTEGLTLYSQSAGTGFIGVRSYGSVAGILGNGLTVESAVNGTLNLAALSTATRDGAVNILVDGRLMFSAYGGGVVLGEGLPVHSAILTINSRRQGVVGPRMTTEEMFKIENPEEGMEVYNLDLHAKCTYRGDGWYPEQYGKKMQPLKRVM